MLLAQNPMTSFVMGIIAVGIVISVLLIQISLNKRRNYLLEELLTEADVSNKRFRAVMQYIPCDILQFDLYDEKLYIIERQSGDKVEIPLHDSSETRVFNMNDTVYPGMLAICKSLKKRIMAGEDTIMELLDGHRGEEFRFGRFTATTVYNSVATPVQAICILEDITNETKEKEHLLRRSQMDILTSLYNKTAFIEEGQRRINANPGMQSAVLFMDLDGFKSLNDTYGHIKGDEAIVEAAMKIKVLFGGQDVVARFGGDEFCILFMNCNREQLVDRLELLASVMKETYQEDDKEPVNITTSIGVVNIPQFGTNLRDLMADADKALYYAKEHGKNQYVFFRKDMELKGYVGRNE